MEREYKDLLVDEPDGGVYFDLVDRAGKTALGPVRAKLKSPVRQPGDRWTAAAANLLLRLDEEGRPKLAIPPKAVGGLCRCTHAKTGSVHALTGEGEDLRFAAVADMKEGDTFTLNGRAMAAKTTAGEPLWPGYFKAGSVVVCHKNGDVLTFSGGGLGSADKKTAEDFLPETKSLLGGSVRGKVPVLAAKRWIPGRADQTIAAHRYTGGEQIVAGDGSLLPQNIRKGVSLFGVAGSYQQNLETVVQYYSSTRDYGTSGWMSTPEFAIPQDGIYVVFLCAGGDRYRGRENFYKNGSIVKQYSGYSNGRTYVEVGYMTAGTTFKAEAGYSYTSEDAYNLGAGMYIARIIG